MSELDPTQQTAGSKQAETAASKSNGWRQPFIRFGRAIDRVFPSYKSADEIAYELARRTPATISVCFALLAGGIIASRLNIWDENFLWGIPSLGAMSLGLGLWIWSSNLILRPGLSQEARETLERAMRFQWTMVAGTVLALIYFFGMAGGLW